MGNWNAKICALTLALLSVNCVPILAAPVESFSEFISHFEVKATAAGIDKAVYRAAMQGVQPVTNIPGLVSSQPEFTTPIWDYMDGRVSSGRINRGQKGMAGQRQLIDKIGTQFGVDPAILGAIWGMETDFGGVLGNSKLIRPIIPALATLVHHRRDRLVEDEAELIAALRLIQDKGWTRASLVGSWAGAIGHTQIIASGLLSYGTDGDGDGQVNPHKSLADAMASTATYLRALGYQPGIDWGFEVFVPEGFDWLLATRTEMRPISFFAARGIGRVKGRQFADPSLPVFLYAPAGRTGPVFLMTANYLVLKGYNFSDSYALSVAHLADRLKGSGAFIASWPRQTQFPNRAERVDIQKWLKKLGFYGGEVDGRIGPITQEAYQQFQAKRGVVADGFITKAAWDLLHKAQ